MRRGIQLIVLTTVLAMPALAVIETYEFSSPQLEQRYHTISQELRCPKCQNQNIADSNAPISQDLRKLLYQQLEAGASDDEILDFMVARYGEFVRYRPKLGGATAILWAAPLLLLIAALAVLLMTLRSRAGESSEQSSQLSEEERQRVAALLDGEQDREREP
jgi:cytochrome c-type biogenesis protein CcmH